MLSNQKIIIIGAGLAGLTAGYRLKKLGFDIDIYEARQRPGGRIFTYYFPQGHYELGGMNFNDGGQAVNLKALCDELKVPYYQFTIKRDYVYYSPAGKILNFTEIFSQMEPPTTELYNRLKECHSMAEVMESLFGKDNDSILKKFMTIRTEYYEGRECDQLSMIYFETFWSFYCNKFENKKIEKPFCTVENGMSRLTEALSSSLEGSIHYNMPLTRIYRQDQKVVVEVGESAVIAHKLILALPSSTLRDVTIEKGLIPDDQMKMIETLAYGTNATIVIPTVGTAQRTCGVDDDCFFFNLSHVHTLFLYFGGSKGIFDEKSLPKRFEKEFPAIKAFYPEFSIEKSIVYAPQTATPFIKGNGPIGISWVNEPYSKGSYSCIAPGQEKLYEQISELCGEKIRTVFRPVNNTIFFAGEHTSVENPSTMEGAVESGERVARMISSQ